MVNKIPKTIGNFLSFFYLSLYQKNKLNSSILLDNMLEVTIITVGNNISERRDKQWNLKIKSAFVLELAFAHS